LLFINLKYNLSWILIVITVISYGDDEKYIKNGNNLHQNKLVTTYTYFKVHNILKIIKLICNYDNKINSLILHRECIGLWVRFDYLSIGILTNEDLCYYLQN